MACTDDDVVLNYDGIFLYTSDIGGNMAGHSPPSSGDVIAPLIAKGSKINSCRDMSLWVQEGSGIWKDGVKYNKKIIVFYLLIVVLRVVHDSLDCAKWSV